MNSSTHPRRLLTGRLHLLRLTMILAAIALVLLSLPPVRAVASSPNDRPTIVLVHGAWAGPSSWDQVVRDLHDDGYQTATPTLGLVSLAADVATVQATLDSIPDNKILVGHSYGGAVISNAAAGRSDVLGLCLRRGFRAGPG